MDFKNPEQLESFLAERRNAAAQTRYQVAYAIGVGQCYYIGMHWIQSGLTLPGVIQSTTGTGRLLTNWNPDTNSLRATVNRTAKHIQRVAAATFPSAMEIDAIPPDSDASVGADFKAQTIEMLCNASIDDSGFKRMARDANQMRCITGVWGLGLYINQTTRNIDGQQVPNKVLKSFTFDPTRLILDPGVTARRLADHDDVVYEDVWTLEKVKRVLGIDIPPDNMPTFGELVGRELKINRLSQNQLYTHYQTHSRSKATTVTQTHFKDETGYFRKMYIQVNGENQKPIAVNFDNPTSPFGGCGLPYVLMHGHRRPGSMWSIGDVAMVKDDQDRMNLLGSLFFRHLNGHAGPRTFIDRRMFPRDTTEEAIAAKFTNRPHSIIIGEVRPEKGIPMPQQLETPPPQAFINDTMAKYEQDMGLQVSLSPYNFGTGLKTHQPDAAVGRLLEQSDQLLGIRVQEDLDSYEDLLDTLVGTNLKLIQEENPGTLAVLRSRGFAEDEFSVCLQSDPYDFGCTLKVRESSVRFRSLQSRQSALDRAAELQAISGMKLRIENAALDSAVTTSDRKMFSSLQKAVHRMLLGEPWQPLPLGEYNELALELLRTALFDRRAAEDPKVKAAVVEAILMQQQAAGQEMAMAQAPISAMQPGTAAPQPEMPEQPQTLDELLMEASGGGRPQGASVPAA